MLEFAPPPHPLHGLQGHLPLRRGDLYPPEPCQGLGPLHRLRTVRFRLPRRCIVPSPEQVQRDTSAADTDNDTIWIGCEKSTRKNTMVRTCICALSWEALAYLALNKKIVLDLTPCGQCENDLCADQLRKELTRLVDFFGQPMFEARFSLAYEEKEYPYHVQELTRREMLEQVSHGSKSGTKKLLQMLPGLRSEEDSGVDFRLLLHQRTKQLKAAMETPCSTATICQSSPTTALAAAGARKPAAPMP